MHIGEVSSGRLSSRPTAFFHDMGHLRSLAAYLNLSGSLVNLCESMRYLRFLSQEIISRHAARFVTFDMGMQGGDTKNLGNVDVKLCIYDHIYIYIFFNA